MLRVANVTVRYDKHIALSDVAVEVARGEIVTILGANGAGKTTLLKTIARLVRPDLGAVVRYNDRDLLAIAAHQVVRTGVAMVPEGRGLFADLTVRENLQLGAYARRAKDTEDQTLAIVLELFPRLGERLRQLVRTMSGGEQQMVAIGRALMSAPDILLLDEPSLGLSPLMCSELFRALQRIRGNGIGILLVEQNARMSLKIADRGYLIETGRIIGHGTAADLRDDPAVCAAYLGFQPLDKTPHGAPSLKA
ncbi:ABC transporter ATP-binding protein [Bradyrhizobium sp. AUGA SZCCT0182]|uniref:ABC transporter ATP-binding protein n=1 Tax=Bradyrhizobium sp. AUGA SZCCT0182 TaxID=2807667 RepID=UPI001BAB998B|nr:ABC transporter ATP-binding protein [Bradyrhizobium sp. AUGA SZCCT0182]MBR1235909.1 ABC transporter ATP-binding protein [Bradyrhizobium sp. AUGA SZCCT0182]